MPNRVIKESIRTSDTLANISAEAERLFWRLVVSADDYGRFDGRPNIILGQCLSAFVGVITPDDVDRWIDELERVGLIRRYAVEGRPYIELVNWSKHQTPRTSKSKYPDPPANERDTTPTQSSDRNCDQLQANDRKRDQMRPLYENENVNENDNEIDQSVNENAKYDAEDESTDMPTDRLDAVEKACREIEIRMTARTQRQWAVKAQDYEAIKSLVAAGVPLSLITQTMDEICEKNPSKRITTFRYFVPAIEERWALERAKHSPAKSLEFIVSARDGPRRPEDDIPGRRVRADVTEEMWERYERLRSRLGEQAESDPGGGADTVVNAHGLS